MEEIIEHVYYEIKNSGFEKKLIGGIVVTGGGAQLKHVTQLFEYITGMDTRIGYPNEHLAPTTTIENVTSPMYATGIGLVVKGFAGTLRKEEVKVENTKVEEPATASAAPKNHSTKTKGGFFDKILTKSRTWFEEED
jgi:cell division protein FtsA